MSGSRDESASRVLALETSRILGSHARAARTSEWPPGSGRCCQGRSPAQRKMVVVVELLCERIRPRENELLATRARGGEVAHRLPRDRQAGRNVGRRCSCHRHLRGHLSKYASGHTQQDLRFLDREFSPALVREPEGNGCTERFFRTLKERLLWWRRLQDLEELQIALRRFRGRDNREWRIEPLRFPSPRQARWRFLSATVRVLHSSPASQSQAFPACIINNLNPFAP